MNSEIRLKVGNGYYVRDQDFARKMECPRFVHIVGDRGADVFMRFVGNDGQTYTEWGRKFRERESELDLVREVTP